MTPPAFDDDAGLAQRVENFAIEQFIAKATSLTPIWRIASAMFWPCDTFAVVRKTVKLLSDRMRSRQSRVNAEHVLSESVARGSCSRFRR